MLLNKFEKADVLTAKPPNFLIDNTHYLVMGGSHMYGCNTATSDKDIVGWCIPPKEMVFPHLAGEIMDFGRQKKRFGEWISGKIQYNTEEYECVVFSVVKFFNLCLDNNPNVLETLFAPIDCVLHCTASATIVRESRLTFLHKGIYPKLKGYAYSQLAKMRSQERVGKRAESVAEHGFDLKFASHTVRLLLEAEMVLTEGDLDLRRHREQIKSIRRGEWTCQQIIDWATAKEKQLEVMYQESKLPWGPDEAKIKAILLNCLETHYGSLEKCVSREQDTYKQGMAEISAICRKLGV
jgi:predicted nucleotidyltransferase